MSQIEKRLQALESKLQQQQVLGWRVFYECDGVFREGGCQGDGPTYSEADLNKLL